MTIFFYETALEDARGRLERLAAALTAQEGSLGCRLLASPEQLGLYLLISEWRGDAPPPHRLENSEGIKRWRFEQVESYGSEGVQKGAQQRDVTQKDTAQKDVKLGR